MTKLVCPECGRAVKKCYVCGSEFFEGDFIICVGMKKHFCSKDCLVTFLMKCFEKQHTVVETYVEKEGGERE